MKLDEFFRCVGGDYGEAKARFQNGERIVRILNMFPGDDSMQNLTNAMNAGDTTTAFRAVHTLKGVALNLGLGSLAHASSQMTEALRGQDKLPESVQPLYEAVQKEHTAVCGALEQLEK
ncbi:Hpt domain-containing protein [bacterium]|nr:Hpt domain-containing protein [bacterium]